MPALHRCCEIGTFVAFEIVSVDVPDTTLDAQLAAVDVLAQLRQGLMRPSRAVGALEVGEDDQDDGSVDGALGQQVVGIARFLEIGRASCRERVQAMAAAGSSKRNIRERKRRSS